MSLAAVTAYEIGVFIHVLAVVVAFGATYAYPVFLTVAERTSPQSLPTVLRGMMKADRVLVTPGMVVILIAGLYLVADAGISLGEPWISIGFLAIIVLFGLTHGYFAPRTREALALVERDLAAGGELSPEYHALSKRVGTVGQLAGLIVVVTIFFMVVKP